MNQYQLQPGQQQFAQPQTQGQTYVPNPQPQQQMQFTQPQLPGGMGGGMGAAINAIAGADVGNRRARYLPEGMFVVDVAEVKIVDKVRGGQGFAVELTIVESDNPNVKPGETWSWFCDLQNKMAQNDAKEWICFLIESMQPGSNPSQNFDPGFVAWICAENQPAKGTRWKAHGWPKQGKKDPTKFYTVFNWEVMPKDAVLGLQPPLPTGAPIGAPQPMAEPSPMAGLQGMPAGVGPTAPQGQVQFVQPVPMQQPQPAPINGGQAPPPNWPQGVPWPPGSGQ